ncbi:MAG: flagellar hook protein FlgE [Candidatus Contubernalis sp.]|nr:flagellar hook protein FlgE [Candidatus Contubernalis sp.]
MQRSLFTAISGLTNHQTKLDVIGNNIANVNTTAFKSSSVRFQDILNQTLNGAMAPQDNRGGVNPIQVGLGMQIAAISTDYSDGSPMNTGRATDLAIEGSGFFIVNDGNQDFYTRDGSFNLDANGNLVNSSGYRVMGYGADEFGGIDEFMTVPLNIPIGYKADAWATSEIIFGGNLRSNSIVGTRYAMEMNIYDSLGGLHVIEIEFTKDDPEDGDNVHNQWSWVVSNTDSLTVPDDGNNGTIVFNTNGSVMDRGTGNVVFTDDGIEDINITLDFNLMSQLVGNTTALMRSQNGYPEGILNSFNIDSAGMVTGAYSNGMVGVLGQIALCRFENPEGLNKTGSNMYLPSANSGLAMAGLPGTQGRGSIRSSSLEMSNVNLAFEFTEMIATSRAFQANSRVISSSDELLQEVFNL